MPFDFRSVGAGMADSLEEELIYQDKMRRQEFLDSLAAQEMQARAEDRRFATESRDYDREGVRANRIAEHSLEGEEFDEATTEVLKRQGYGHMIRPTEVMGNVQADGETDDTRDPNRTANLSRGGTRQAQARTAAQEKAQLAERQLQAKAESDQAKIEAQAQAAKEKREADAQRERDKAELQVQLKGMDVSSKNHATDTAAAAKSEAAAEKKAAAEKDKESKRKVVKDMANDTLGVLNQLLDEKTDTLKPGVSQVVGNARVPAWLSENVGGIPLIAPDAPKFQSLINQLKGRQIVDLIGEMKSQSRTGATGFGALSGPELKILESSVGRLLQSQDEASFASALKEVRTHLQKVMVDPAESGLGTGGATTVDSATMDLFNKYAQPSGGAKPASATDFISRRRASRGAP
jgi:hypothetical protein